MRRGRRTSAAWCCYAHEVELLQLVRDEHVITSVGGFSY